jgi:hypothetical protein
LAMDSRPVQFLTATAAQDWSRARPCGGENSRAQRGNIDSAHRMTMPTTCGRVAMTDHEPWCGRGAALSCLVAVPLRSAGVRRGCAQRTKRCVATGWPHLADLGRRHVAEDIPVSHMLKAIHAQESRAAADRKARAIVDDSDFDYRQTS